MNATPKERIRSTFSRGSKNHSSELEEPTPRTESSESSTTEDLKRREALERNRYSAMRSRIRKREVFDQMKKETKHLSMENNILRKIHQYLIAKIISISFHHMIISIEIFVKWYYFVYNIVLLNCRQEIIKLKKVLQEHIHCDVTINTNQQETVRW